MASQITLADGTKATVDTGNFSELARLQIGIKKAKYGSAYTIDQQAAELQAFKQLAGLPPVYNIGANGAATLDDPAIAIQQKLDGNPLVALSNAVTHPGQTLSHISATVKEGLSSAAGFVSSANTTVKIGLVVAGIAGVAVILFYSHKIVKTGAAIL